MKSYSLEQCIDAVEAIFAAERIERDESVERAMAGWLYACQPTQATGFIARRRLFRWLYVLGELSYEGRGEHPNKVATIAMNVNNATLDAAVAMDQVMVWAHDLAYQVADTEMEKALIELGMRPRDAGDVWTLLAGVEQALGEPDDPRQERVDTALRRIKDAERMLMSLRDSL